MHTTERVGVDAGWRSVRLVAVYCAVIVAAMGTPTGVSAQPLHGYVDPFIGSQGKGNVFVGPACPFGMVKPGPDCDLGTCQPKLAVGTTISPDGCGLFNMSEDNTFGGGSAEQCVTGACFLDETGDAKCALPAQYGCAGSDHVKTLASLLGLFGIVLASRRRKRS